MSESCSAGTLKERGKEEDHETQGGEMLKREKKNQGSSLWQNYQEFHRMGSYKVDFWTIIF